MLLQPAFAMPKQLLDLVLADPIVLLVVEHRDQHIEMRQQAPQRGHAAQRQVPIRSLADGRYGQRIAEWLEQQSGEIGAATAPQRGQARLKRDRQLCQVRSMLRSANKC